jgi:CRISPR-associated protein Cas1
LRLLTTLYLTDHRAQVRSDHRSLVVVNGDGTRSRVPVDALEAVVIVGHGQITSDALTLCTLRHVRVASLRGNGRLRFLVGGATSGNVHLRLAQYRAADDVEHTCRLARWIVAGKLQNARRLIQRWSWDAGGGDLRSLRRLISSLGERMEKVDRAGSGDAIRGIEGDGTRIYFQALREHLATSGCQMAFGSRTRRPPRDAVNAALGFAYGVLLTEVAGAAEALGLDPQVGFLHGVRPGRPSLALDLLEELRPSIADRFVAGLLTRRMLVKSDFVRTAGGAYYLTDEGRRKFLTAYEEFKTSEIVHPLLGRRMSRSAVPVVQATLLARHLRGDLPAYPPFVAEG